MNSIKSKNSTYDTRKFPYFCAKMGRGIIPIQWFKQKDFLESTLFDRVLKDFGQSFYSSGTSALTSAVHHKILNERSTSMYSKSGLLSYRKGARSFFQEVFRDFNFKSGISLIPPTDIWPNSSLATMIAWLKEDLSHTVKICYVDAEVLTSLAHEISACEGPFFIFGTGFHFINLFDAGFRFNLPQNAFLIETGGTKGKSRSVSAEEYLEALTSMFEISPEQIMSEYGMCELASQAYRVGFTNRYYFPPTVDVYVMSQPGKLETHGKGLLCVFDSARIDIPMVIQTEDYAELFPDKSFILHGRLSSSELKGCSLRAEKPEVMAQLRSLPKFISPVTLSHFEWDAIAVKVDAFKKQFTEFLNSSEVFAALEDEFQSSHTAKNIVTSFEKSIPQSSTEWLISLKKSVPSKNIIRKWHFILPNNHSLAGFYPLVFAHLLGLDISVKPGKKRFRFINAILKFLNVPSVAQCPSTAAIFIFGEDKTVQLLQNETAAPINSFGSSIAGSILTVEEFQHVPTRTKLLSDIASLNQRGCKSSRIVLVYQFKASVSRSYSMGYDEVGCGQLLAFQDFFDRGIQEFEYIQFYNNQILMPIIPSDSLDLANYISSRPFVAPMITFESFEWLEAFLTNNHEIKRLSCGSNIIAEIEAIASKAEKTKLEVCELGTIQDISWSGFYEGKPLFMPIPQDSPLG